MKKKISTSYVILVLILICFGLFCLLPAVIVVSGSLSTMEQLTHNGYRLIPTPISFDAYEMLFNDMGRIFNAYTVTIYITVVGTASSLIISAMASYSLSMYHFKHRSIVSFIVYFTMIFSGGLVPYYILVTQYLKLADSLLVLILQGIAQPFIIFLLRVFFTALPKEFSESARIDGANDFVIFFKLYLPLAAPGIATAGLILSLSYWNEYVNTLLFITSENKFTLQLLLMRVVNYVEYLKRALASGGIPLTAINIPNDAIIMATCIVSIGPMFLIYLFFQKYFIKGIVAGGLKG